MWFIFANFSRTSLFTFCANDFVFGEEKVMGLLSVLRKVKDWTVKKFRKKMVHGRKAKYKARVEWTTLINTDKAADGPGLSIKL